MMNRGHAWTIDETATLVRMARAGYGDVEIGRQLGLSAAAIGRKRRALGVTGGMPARLRIVIARRALPNGGRKSLP
jgi:hypothetical protein